MRNSSQILEAIAAAARSAKSQLAFWQTLESIPSASSETSTSKAMASTPVSEGSASSSAGMVDGDDTAGTRSSTAFIRETSADDMHPPVDMTNPVTLTRLIALHLSDWRLDRGRGPRSHTHCLWCRGSMSDSTEILVHTAESRVYNTSSQSVAAVAETPVIGTDQDTPTAAASAQGQTVQEEAKMKEQPQQLAATGHAKPSWVKTTTQTYAGPRYAACDNAWPVGCFLEWISIELDNGEFPRALRCPICRVTFYTRWDRFRIYDFKKPSPEFVPAAWFRVMVCVPTFGDEWIREPQDEPHGRRRGEKRLIIMDRTEVAKLPLFGRDKKIFKRIDRIGPEVKKPEQEKRKTVPVEPETKEERKEKSNSKGKEKVAAHRPELRGARQKEQGEPERDHVFTTWAVLDWGHNEFRMIPIPKTRTWSVEVDDGDSDDSDADQPMLDPASVLTKLTAADLVKEAISKGGLARAIHAFQPNTKGNDEWPSWSCLQERGRRYYLHQIVVCMDAELGFKGVGTTTPDENAAKKVREEMHWYGKLLEVANMPVRPGDDEFQMLYPKAAEYSRLTDIEIESSEADADVKNAYAAAAAAAASEPWAPEWHEDFSGSEEEEEDEDDDDEED
ncbi:hypothetical protein ABEF95_001141 [Exophiala dermatitidis]